MKEMSMPLFKKAAIISIVLGCLVMALSFIMGKADFFLLLNADLGRFADLIFQYITYLGDGAIWVPIVLLIIWKQRKQLVLVLSTISTTTLFAQLIKSYVFPAEPRPTNLIEDKSLIHTVSGVELHTIYSFPSGHTTTAFSIFLLATILIPKRWMIPVGLAYALLVGYSRIYLAQHFPLDVGAGMIFGTISVWLSVLVQKSYDKSFKELAN